MKIRLYQINLDRDKDHVAFMGLEEMQKTRGSYEIDSTIYDEVFNGETEDGGLDDIFRTFNLNHPKGYKGRSMSISDIIEYFLNDGKSVFWYCDVIGFVTVGFRPEHTMPLRSRVKPEWGNHRYRTKKTCNSPILREKEIKSAFEAILQKLKDPAPTYSDERWRTLVKSVTIFPDRRLSFKLTEGKEIEVHV